MSEASSAETGVSTPRLPASAGALIHDEAEHLLVLKPTYKKGWTVPGGQIEANGESPWEACRRETWEECGIEVSQGRLVCVDFLRPRGDRLGGLRFLFDCGTFSPSRLGTIALQKSEIAEYRFVELAEAIEMLSGPVRRRVAAGAGQSHCVYLEDGRPVAEVGA